MAVSGDGVRLQSPSLVGAADDHGALPRHDVRRTGRIHPPVVEIDSVHHDHLAAHRADVLVAGETSSAEPGAVDHDTVVADRQRSSC